MHVVFIEQWTMSLRDHWSYEPKIGDLYAARVDCSKEMTAEIEQIGSPVKANLYDILRGVSASGKNEETNTLTAYNHFLEKCEKRFSKVDIYRPQFHGFQVNCTYHEVNVDSIIDACHFLWFSNSTIRITRVSMLSLRICFDEHAHLYIFMHLRGTECEEYTLVGNWDEAKFGHC
jgi:hypothetical protein